MSAKADTCTLAEALAAWRALSEPARDVAISSVLRDANDPNERQWWPEYRALLTLASAAAEPEAPKPARPNWFLDDAKRVERTAEPEAKAPRFFVEHGAWHDIKTGKHLHDIVVDQPASERLDVLLKVLSGHDQTPEEARAELEAAGVDVERFLAQVDEELSR